MRVKIKEWWVKFKRFSGAQKIALLPAALYLVCMVVWPIAEYRDWAGIQAVWDRWQALNVGVLAFSASVIFWYAAHLRSRENDIKEYKAARGFLVFVASELCREFKIAAHLLKQRLKSRSYLALDGIEPFSLPQHLHPYLERYIKYAPPESAQFIIDFIRFYQVYMDRLNTVLGDISDRPNPKDCIATSIGDLCNISARTNRLFGYARGINSLDTSKVRWEEIKEGVASYLLLLEPDSNLFHGDFFEKHAGDVFDKKES